MPDYVFISYSHKDSDYAHKLAESLEQAGITPWVDDRIDYAAEWPRIIQERLDACSAFIVVMTPRSYESTWVHNELSRAMRMDKPVYPLLLEGDTWISVESIQYVDVRNGDMPPERFFDGIARHISTSADHQVELAEPPVQVSEPISKPIISKPPAEMMQITTPVQMELIRVPAGEFLMGSDPAKDEDASSFEQPQHRLNVAEFYIGRYPVTNLQYSVFVKAKDRDAPVHWEKGDVPKGKTDHPVANVTWYDAIAFSKWLSGEAGQAFHLPSEAQWEYAARGGPVSKGYLYAGGDHLDGVAWFEANSGNDTHPVGKKKPNELGIYDMSGNVWEWTRSLWGKDQGKPDFKYPYTSRDGREDLKAPLNLRRVLRGGAFSEYPQSVRCTYRNSFDPDFPVVDIGFRGVVSPSGSDL